MPEAGEQSSMEMLNSLIKKSNGGILEFWVVLLTAALICIKYILLPENILDGDETTKSLMHKKNLFITIAYILVIIMAVFYINYNGYHTTCLKNTSKEMSSEAVYFLVMVSVFPWMSILGICYAVLNVLPGWKSPFSNTFGYFITMFMLGGQHMIDEILDIPNAKDEDEAIRLVLENNFGNLINDYTPNNIAEFRHIGSVIGASKLKTKPYLPGESVYNNIAKLIMLKDFIAEGIWFMLMGIFVVNITDNYISVEACI